MYMLNCEQHSVQLHTCEWVGGLGSEQNITYMKSVNNRVTSSSFTSLNADTAKLQARVSPCIRFIRN